MCGPIIFESDSANRAFVSDKETQTIKCIFQLFYYYTTTISIHLSCSCLWQARKKNFFQNPNDIYLTVWQLSSENDNEMMYSKTPQMKFDFNQRTSFNENFLLGITNKVKIHHFYNILDSSD